MTGKIHVDSIDVITKLEAAIGRFQAEAVEPIGQADADIRRMGERLEEHRRYLNRQLEERNWEVKQAEKTLRDCLNDKDANCEWERDELADAKRARRDVLEKIQTMDRLVNKLRASVADFIAESRRFAIVRDEICPRAREWLKKYTSALEKITSITIPESTGASVAIFSNFMASGGFVVPTSGGSNDNDGFNGVTPSSSTGAGGIGLAHRFEIKDINDLNEMLRILDFEYPEIFPYGFKEIYEVTGMKYFMATCGEGEIMVNNNTFSFRNHRFNAADQTISAMTKIRAGKSLSFDEEYAVECLWHEICHNRSFEQWWTYLGDIDENNEDCLESLNQLVARCTYHHFLTILGGKDMHSDKILHEGYGHHRGVNNFRLLINNIGLDDNIILPNLEKVLFETKYDNNFRDSLANTLSSLSGKGKENIEHMLQKITEEKADVFHKSLLREFS